jgi:hypothetical protein
MAQASEQPSGGVHKETQIEARGQFTADGRRWTQIKNRKVKTHVARAQSSATRTSGHDSQSPFSFFTTEGTARPSPNQTVDLKVEG